MSEVEFIFKLFQILINYIFFFNKKNYTHEESVQRTRLGGYFLGASGHAVK